MPLLRTVSSLSFCAFLAAFLSPAGAMTDYNIPDELDPPDTTAQPAIKYRNPLVEMMRSYHQPVQIEIDPAWNLTELQKDTALQPPCWVIRKGRVRYYYPEDAEPTPEQIADGTALTPKQRRLIHIARARGRQQAAWKARLAAEEHNRLHSQALAAVEKAGRHIVIQLGKQRGSFMEGAKEIRSFRVCSGKRSTPTPKGHFHVMEKHKDHRSNLYNNAAMPFFMRLTVDGVGLHQGPVRSWPASHGCIRLRYDDARYLFEQCEVGTPVFVID